MARKIREDTQLSSGWGFLEDVPHNGPGMRSGVWLLAPLCPLLPPVTFHFSTCHKGLETGLARMKCLSTDQHVHRADTK